MKNRNLFLVFAILLGMSLNFVGCKPEKKDDPDPKPNPENLAGEITKAVSLDASKTYKLDGSLVVKDGAVLTIPAGTKIVAKGGTTSYIIVAQGGKIMVEGTAAKPVVMTSDKKEPGSWGGLVICGKAPVNTGKGMSEVGNLPYGGNVADDNSGVIKYLRVEYTGYNYTEEKQFNGVSFFGVGSGTVVDYLVSYNGNDDGIEFFGGTVNASHLVSVNSQDDGIDFADGWNGTGEYWYSLNSKKSGIEGSNNGTNGDATPMTDAKISNITVYKMGEKPWYLKEGAGKQKITNLVIGGLAEGKKHAYFYASSKDNEAKARIDAGDIKFEGVKFVNIGIVGKAVDGVQFTEDKNATGAGNGIEMPSWMPAALNDLRDGNKVFPSDLSNPTTSAEEEELGGKNITGELSLDASVAYSLNGTLLVKEGGKLTIPAGTTITAKTKTSYVIVAQGGKIMIEGTAAKPVVMTSNTKEHGSWGGLVLCGKAPVNTGKGLSEVGNLPYGGNVADDNSGVIKYLRVEYTGYNYTEEKQFNGVSFFGVGSGTTVEYVSSFNGNDDGIEFFGGTVSAKYLVSIGSQDDGIDFADGWNGNGEFWYVKDTKKSGIEGSNNGTNGGATPMTTTTLKNLTIMGMGDYPWYLKEGAGKQKISNVVIGGLTKPKKSPYFYAKGSDEHAKERIKNGDIKIDGVKFVNIGEVKKAVDGLTVNEDSNATGAGNGENEPDWAKGWSSPK